MFELALVVSFLFLVIAGIFNTEKTWYWAIPFLILAGAFFALIMSSGCQNEGLALPAEFKLAQMMDSYH
jgi:hypothetical membrane protein